MLIQLLGGKRSGSVLISKTVTSNGVYNATDYDADGFNIFTVAVPEPTGTLSITTNGTQDVKNYASVNVMVPNGTETKNITVNGTYTPTSPNIGFSSVTVAVPEPTGTLNITTNGIKDVKNYASVDVNVGGGSVIDSLSITPTTSSQTIVATGGTDGYSPITVAAVDSNIDANILSNNIKNGVTILGITGSLVELNGVETTITPATSTKIVTPYSPHNGFTKVTVPAVTSAIDANIVAENIKNGVTILGVSGSVTELNGTTTTINPSTSSQTVTPTSPNNGFTEVTVPAVTSAIDANITAGNIKSGVTILGVTGTATLAPDYYIQRELSVLGTLTNTSSNIINMNGVQDIGERALAYAYSRNSNTTSFVAPNLTKVTGYYACLNTFGSCTNLTTINMSLVTSISGEYGCLNMCNGCTGLTSINLSSLTTVSGTQACETMFKGCTGLTSINLNNLQTISGGRGCNQMFQNCTGLTSVSLGNLKTISGGSGAYQMFYGCTGLTSIDLSKLDTLTGNSACEYMFVDCSNLASVDLSKLSYVTGSYCCSKMFQGTSISSLSFPALTSTAFGSNTNQFRGMLNSVTGCTVHFPSNLQAVIGSWSDVTGGFGGTNTTVLFDLPATT